VVIANEGSVELAQAIRTLALAMTEACIRTGTVVASQFLLLTSKRRIADGLRTVIAIVWTSDNSVYTAPDWIT